MGQVHANQGLSADLLGPDVNEENFAERMVAIIAERRRTFAAQRFQDKRNKPMDHLPLPGLSGPLEQETSSSAAGIKTYSTGRKSLGSRKMSSSEVDLNAADKSFIKVLSDDDSDDSDGDTNPFYWHAFAAWEIVPTGLGDVNALYFTDKSSKYFTHLKEILHLLDRQDLSKLYGMVKFRSDQKGIGLFVAGDCFLFSGVQDLETISGTVLNMFEDTPLSSSASTIEEIVEAKREVEINGRGNDIHMLSS
ncbi:hypothetical protein Tco_1174238 [Tanacetum coccineum]